MIEKLGKASYIIAVTLIASFILACGLGIVMDQLNLPVVNTVVEMPTPIPTLPAVVETYSLPSTITYQVESVSRDNLQVFTTNGDALYFHDYYEWDTQVRKCVYTAKIVEQTGIGYIVEDPRIEEAYIPLDHGHDGMYVAS